VRALIALAALWTAAASAQPAPIEPIDDLQRLFIEDTVALIKPPSPVAGERAKALMEHASAARASGDNGAMRRFLAEARIVLAGREWTAGQNYLASLALRPERIVLDPARPLRVAVGQFYAAAQISACNRAAHCR
jgi:hypothetical protein